MKLIALIIMVACLQVSASSVAQRVTLSENRASLQKVLREIRKQSDVDFIFKTNLLKKTKPVTIQVKNGTLEEVLKIVFDGQPVDYILDNKSIIVRNKEEAAAPAALLTEATARAVASGKVTDSKNEPLPGVSVQEKGTQNGTVTNARGEFSFNLQQPNAILVFRLIGHVSKEVPAGTGLNIVLETSTASIDEVVVTALGIRKEKKKLGYAITELKGEEFTQAREPNVAYALTGKVAGVNVVKPATGASGSSRVIIRGNGSISGNNQPLYVVNGIPIDNSNFGQPDNIYGGADGGDGIGDINPDDIETMTVLKGATAAALYGSRASNGAIVITTKKGATRKGIGVELNSVYSVETPVVHTAKDYQYVYGQGTNGKAPLTKDEAFQIGIKSWGAKMDGSPVMQFDGVARPYSPVKNNIRNFYNNAHTFTNTVSLHGGNENTTFRFSASDMRNKDLFPNSGIDRNNFSFNGSTRLGTKLTINASAMYLKERVKNRPRVNDSDGSGNWLIYQLPGSADVRNLKQQVGANGGEYLFSSNIYAANPYFIAYRYVNNDEKDRLLANVEAKYDFTDAFYAKLRVGNDFINRHSTFVRPWGSAVAKNGGMSETMTNVNELNTEAIVGYNKNAGKNFSINAFAGGNIMKRSNKSLNAGGNEFIVPNFNSINNTKSPYRSYYLTERQINSLFGFAEVGYKNQLFLSVTGRNDWFSTLSKDNNNIFYPSVGLSYILSEGVRMPSWISYAKLRASWAQAGGDTDPYALGLTYSMDGTIFNQPLGYINESTIPNTNLRPLTSTTAEAGFEARFFSSRLGIDFTYYTRKTTDDILSSTISEASGFNSVRLNVGEIKNSGIELLIDGNIIEKGPFQWKAAFNMAYNNSKIVRLVDGTTSFTVATSRPGYWGDAGVPAYVVQEVGQPYGIIKGYTYKRDAGGNIIYNKQGLPVRGEITKLGNGVAPLTLGFTNTLNYRGFSFSFLIDGRFGGKVSSATNNFAYFTGLHKKTLEGRETGVVGKGVDEDGHPNAVNVPAEQYYGYIANNISEEFIYDASFLKLRQAILTYTLPARITGRTPFSGISLSVVGRNLATFIRNVPVVDPETSFSTGNIQGFEMLSLPATRSWGINLNVKL